MTVHVSPAARRDLDAATVRDALLQALLTSGVDATVTEDGGARETVTFKLPRLLTT